jgi:hypothetical protein
MAFVLVLLTARCGGVGLESLSHSENRGSSPLGSANDFKHIGNISNSGVHFSNFSPIGRRPEQSFAQAPRKGRHPQGAAIMSEASQFRQYADDALRWAANATTEKERRSLMRLARTWVEAAAMSQNPMLVGNYISTDHNTAR